MNAQDVDYMAIRLRLLLMEKLEKNNSLMMLRNYFVYVEGTQKLIGIKSLLNS